MANFFERWGLVQTDEDAWEEFINRLITVICGNTSSIEMSLPEIEGVALTLGKRPTDISNYNRYTQDYLLRIDLLIDVDREPIAIARNLEVVMQYIDSDKAETVKLLCDKSSCGFRLVKKKGEWVSYPAGEELLDHAIVEKTLGFLEGSALVEYRNALDRYTSGKPVDCAEKARRSLEEYLRTILDRKKLGLTNCIEEYGRRMKAHDVPEHMRSLVNNELKTLDRHYNESSKHQSVTISEEAEYLIYATGSLMNLINTLDENFCQ